MVLFWSRAFLLMILGFIISSCGSGNLSLSKMKTIKYVEIGDDYYKNKNFVTAHRYYEKALKSDKNLDNDLYFLSRMIKVLGEQNIKKEIKKIKARIKNDDSEIYYYCLGKIEHYLQNFEASRTYFKKARTKAPKNKMNLYKCLIDRDC